MLILAGEAEAGRCEKIGIFLLNTLFADGGATAGEPGQAQLLLQKSASWFSW
jgi:hypothetical protein